MSTSAPEQQDLEQYVSGAPEGVGCVEESVLGGVVWKGLSEEATFELRSEGRRGRGGKTPEGWAKSRRQREQRRRGGKRASPGSLGRWGRLGCRRSGWLCGVRQGGPEWAEAGDHCLSSLGYHVTLGLGTHWTHSTPPHAPLLENDFSSLATAPPPTLLPSQDAWGILTSTPWVTPTLCPCGGCPSRSLEFGFSPLMS